MTYLAVPKSLIAALALSLLCGCNLPDALTESDSSAAEPGAQTTPQAAPRRARVYRVPAASGSRDYHFVARVEAAQTIDLAFEVSGTLETFGVKEGQEINRGGLIAGLKQTDFELDVEEAAVDLQLKRNDHQRKSTLLRRNGISKAAVDDAAAALKLAQVKLKQARESLRETRLLAPFDAYVAQRYVDNHTNIQSAVPVVRLLDLRRFHLSANVPEALLATMSANDIDSLSARFSFSPDRAYPIRYLEHRGEAQKVAQTYEVTFEMAPPTDITLLPGMTATITVVSTGGTNQTTAFEIPQSSLATSPANALGVWVFEESSQRVRWQPVAAQPTSQGNYRITQGLRGNELIVTTGVSLLRTDMQIDPITESGTAAF